MTSTRFELGALEMDTSLVTVLITCGKVGE